MKPKLLFLSLLICATSLFAQTISFPDPNFKLKIIADGVDTNNDGEIQISEALAVTHLDVKSLYNDPIKITNLSGVEHFSNLTELNCSGNLLTSLDVSTLTNLEVLKAYSNQLSSINLTGLINLEYLWIQDNLFQSIDLSPVQNLDWIWCSDNQLTALDVSGLPNLKAIWAENNEIDVLDFLPLQNLEYIMVSYNKLSHLDVNHLSNLQELWASNNSISAIDVSNMPNLELLDLGSNQLLDIDCSLTGVRYLHCGNNPGLVSINAQNGVVSYSDPDMLNFGFIFDNLPNLLSICIDPGEEDALDDSGYDPTNVTIYTGPNCSLSNVSFKLDKTYIYPNPVATEFNIASADNISNFLLFDSLGRTLTIENNYGFLKDKVSTLKPGLYFLKIESHDKTSETIRFLKD